MLSIKHLSRHAKRAAFIGVLSVFATGMTVTVSQAAELIFNNYAPPKSKVTAVLFDQFARDIEEKTNGEVTVTIPSTSMAPVSGNWDLVTQGVADVVNQPRYVQPKQFQLTTIAELPFNTLSSESASVALNRTYDRYFAELGEYDDVKVLAFTVFAGRQIMNNKHPVNTVEDYEGLKIWTTPGPLAKSVEATGATPVAAPFPKLFEFASKGTVDGMIFTPSTARSSQTGPYVKYFTEVPGGLGNISFALVMNKDSWNRLTPEQQATVQEIADTLPSRYGQAQDADEKSALASLDIEVQQASPELVAELKKRLASSEAAWIATAKAAGLENPEEVLAYYRQEMEKVAASQAE